jgi:hypothetical protein
LRSVITPLAPIFRGVIPEKAVNRLLSRRFNAMRVIRSPCLFEGDRVPKDSLITVAFGDRPLEVYMMRRQTLKKQLIDYCSIASARCAHFNRPYFFLKTMPRGKNIGSTRECL